MTRTDVLQVLQTTPDRIAALVQGVASEEGGGSSRGGDWSMSQVIDHLLLGERDLILPRQKRMHLEDCTVFASSTLSETGFAALPQGGNAGELLATFRRARHETFAFLNTLSDADWQRVGTTPTRGTLTIEAYAKYLAEHDLEHLAQLEGLPGTDR